MRNNLLISLCLAAPLAAAAHAQSGPEGHWEGKLDLNTRQVEVVIDLAKDAKGQWVGSLGVPSQNAAGLSLSDLTITGNSVKFRVRQVPQEPAFDLTLGQGPVLKGSISAGDRSMPIELKRTGEAKVILPVASPAVPKELEGDWEGALETPGGTLRLVVHFKNQEDKTVAATLDSVTQGAMGLPLDDVKQAGTKVEFALKRVGGRFQGEMNKEATQITGEWSQSGSSLPLTWKKK